MFKIIVSIILIIIIHCSNKKKDELLKYKWSSEKKTKSRINSIRKARSWHSFEIGGYGASTRNTHSTSSRAAIFIRDNKICAKRKVKDLQFLIVKQPRQLALLVT